MRALDWVVLVGSLIGIVGYGLYKAEVFGNTGLLIYAGVIGFTPLILAALVCPFFKPESLRPILTPPTSA